LKTDLSLKFLIDRTNAARDGVRFRAFHFVTQVRDQGDRIGRIFAHLVIFYFGQLF
jgi:hypothetical protein